MKIFLRSFFFFIFFLIISIFYLSTFGFETDKFNSQIINKIKNVDKRINIELKKIKIVLNPLSLKLDIKTIGSKLKTKNTTIETENIRTQISLISLLKNEYSIKNLEISTKSTEIKNLVSFVRSFKNTPELFLLEKTIRKGFIIADINLEFDTNGKIKENYQINGFIKDARLNILKRYDLQKINLIFEYKNSDILFNDISFSLNGLNFLSENVLINKVKNDIFVNGNLNNKKLNIDQKNFNLLIKPFIPELDLKKLVLSSNNIFSFRINDKLRFNNFEISSEMLVDELTITNKYDLKTFFPNIKKNISLINNKIIIKYKKNDLSINGSGNLAYQDKQDKLNYLISKKNDDLNFETSLIINENPFVISFLDYKKNHKDEISINIKGSKNKKNNTLIKSININDKENIFSLKNLLLNTKNEIIKLDEVLLKYTDTRKQKNSLKFYKKNNKFFLKGSFFNADKLIDDLLFNESENLNFFSQDIKIKIDIDKVYLDNEYYLTNFSGDIFLKNKKLFKADLNGNFSNDKKLKFTISNTDFSKITTLYIDRAEPVVKRYKFVKGFEGGSLDFNSSKKSGESISQLRIYDFKLKELPLLTKILTLASLQGVADILTGEGIRFDEFEMNFKNKDNLMTIDEIYAIGPAISILMDGYIEKNNLVSLRGTLVPATTINKFIGSLPVLGKILVGSKTGEGVFGVSFKIKGPPKKMETSVNPIKTLTPRFITRTLEKIKKN
ncbi:AsmA-like C-terminal region-containing protein [Candidatus Pelagibacter sp.]|nr:AsmA-like C-terminal region-containing protein [Candidatus Pelagibacter sp.]